MKGLFGLFVLFFSISFSASAQIKVLSTIKPLHMIVLEISQGAAESEYLLPSGSSPHDFAMRPSDVMKIRQADVVFWVGPELEQFFTRIAPSLSTAIAITEQKDITFREYEEGYHVDHGDHHHDHDGIDPHVWLGPVQAGQIADAVARSLIEKDPLHKQTYLDNLAAFKDKLVKKTQDIETALAPVAEAGYFVFHDAYGYFESQFSLNNLGHFTVAPDRRPGAKTLISIKTRLKEEAAVCVFREPQFEPAVIQSVVRGTNVRVGMLDPVGGDIEAQPGSYFTFLDQMTAQYLQCLHD
ncbi:zinc ABC transporter substrate-binding protein ZnuA [Thaumasiovibrio subtropicus]|uniref:zinc ABC transporter substrate-binding protein ZnuA n=1 Tax=Thaumasiovibrio subtropicus TaxID=1891207 RepID=UPI000B34C0B9|nr:zinc ABC transporter substrate-binding protein ZnuA [Thaumasiovibrio subtropicus]